jgi:hypothetical protein
MALSTDLSFLEQNKVEYARLRQLIARLNDADLARSVGGGWTVAVALAHVAFWDGRVLVSLDRWEREGTVPMDIDGWVVNEAQVPLWLVIPPRAAAQLALSNAEAVLKRIDGLGPEKIEAMRNHLNLVRATHWSEHVEQIESALKG